LDEFKDTKYLLESVINLGFTGNPQISKNLAMILMKVLNKHTLGIFEDDKCKNL
jgi:hypothetical protein